MSIYLDLSRSFKDITASMDYPPPNAELEFCLQRLPVLRSDGCDTSSYPACDPFRFAAAEVRIRFTIGVLFSDVGFVVRSTLM